MDLVLDLEVLLVLLVLSHVQVPLIDLLLLEVLLTVLYDVLQFLLLFLVSLILDWGIFKV